MTMQQPTLTNVHVHSIEDAHKIFYAVELGMLPKIEKRLDAHERAALQPGNVYIWEEKAPSADNYTVTMERFTEGKSWTASRVRDDFLMYYESTKKKSRGDQEDGSQKARSLENQVVREGERDLYIKLTYSVYRTDTENSSGASASKDKERDRKKPRKWHLNAYFTKFTEGQLRTIDEIPILRDLAVPEGLYKTARATTKSTKRTSSDTGGAGKASSSSVQRTYAPFPSSHPRHFRAQEQQQHTTSVAMSASLSLAPAPPAGFPPQAQTYQSNTALPPLVQPQPGQQRPLPPPHTIVDGPLAPSRPSPTSFPQYMSYASAPSLPSQVHTTYQPKPIEQPTHFLDPPSSLYPDQGQNTPGSGSGSSEHSMASPLSDSYAWSPHTPRTPHTAHEAHFSQMQTYSHSTPSHHRLVIPHPHTPSLSDSASSSAASSASPYSISMGMDLPMGGGVMDEEEDLSGYVPAPPPFVAFPSTSSSSSSSSQHHDIDPNGFGSFGMSMNGMGGGNGSSGSMGFGSDAPRPVLAPLHTLGRDRTYKRCSVDDKALRLLGPGTGAGTGAAR